MSNIAKTSIAVFIGLVLGGVALFGLYSLHQDHVELQSVILFLNKQIQTSQVAPASK